MKTANDLFLDSAIDYSGVYGGPPTRSLFRQIYASEIPVFAYRVPRDASFFSDIFHPESCSSAAPSNISSFCDSQGVKGGVNLSNLSDHARVTIGGTDSLISSVADLNDKEYKSDRRLPCSESYCLEPEGTSKSNGREEKGVSLAALLQTESNDNGKLRRGKHGKVVLPLITRDRHFHSFSCSRGSAVDILNEEDDFNVEGSNVREMFQKVKNKVLLSRANPASSRLPTGTSVRHKIRSIRRSSAIDCRFFHDVKTDDANPKNICEGLSSQTTASKERDTLKEALLFKARPESNSHSTSKVSDSSISKNVRESGSDKDSDHRHVNAGDCFTSFSCEMLENCGSETEEMKIVEKVRSWSDGKEGNIRSLLSTLQYVLWAGSGWNPVRLADIVEESAVKKSYQKALLCLHPDKLQQKGALNSEKVTAQMVFDKLQEAWTHFNP